MTRRKRLSVVIVAMAVLAAVVAIWSLKRDGSERAAPGDASHSATSPESEN